MISYARALGLGEPTGINAPGESAGKLPYGNNNPRIYSHGDDFEVTPLQLAVMVSALTNGGKKIVPQIPRSGYEKANFQGAMRGEVKMPKDKMQGVLPGMIGAVNYGTARRAGATQFSAAGKTGSCTGQGSWLGLFASVAPVVNPKLAVVVITRGQAERGKYASAIAGRVYQALAPRLRETGVTKRTELIAKVPQELKPQPKVDAKTSALVDNDEGEDSDEGDVNNAKIKSETVKRANPKKGGDDVQSIDSNNGGASLKSPAKSADKSSNLFKPIVINVKKSLQQEEPLSRPRIVPTNK
jgi:membrane peptidoglycan carboxypeptidase